MHAGHRDAFPAVNGLDYIFSSPTPDFLAELSLGLIAIVVGGHCCAKHFQWLWEYKILLIKDWKYSLGYVAISMAEESLPSALMHIK